MKILDRSFLVFLIFVLLVASVAATVAAEKEVRTYQMVGIEARIPAAYVQDDFGFGYNWRVVYIAAGLNDLGPIRERRRWSDLVSDDDVITIQINGSYLVPQHARDAHGIPKVSWFFDVLSEYVVDADNRVYRKGLATYRLGDQFDGVEALAERLDGNVVDLVVCRHGTSLPPLICEARFWPYPYVQVKYEFDRRFLADRLKIRNKVENLVRTFFQN